MGEGILEHGFLKTLELAGHPVVLPKNAVLAYGEDEFIIATIYQYPLEHLVEIQCLGRNVLEKPVQLAGVNIDSHRGIGEESDFVDSQMTAHRHPGFLLRRAPVGEL